jgi:hypothetical protein
MTQAWRAFHELVPVLVVLVIAAGCLFLLLPRLSDRGMRRVGVAAAGLWFAAVCLITLHPRPAILTVDGSTRPVDLVPFRSVYDLLFSADANTSAGQVLGNLVLFAPIGVLAPIIWPVARAAGRNALLTGVGLAVLIEVSQWAMASGRVASIDDVLLAGVGTCLGYLLGAPAMSWWIGLRDSDPEESTRNPVAEPTPPGH